MRAPPNKALQQTGLSLACGSLWRPQLNAATLGGAEGRSSHMCAWTKFRRDDGQSTDGGAFIALRRTAIAFNAYFVRTYKLDACTRTTVFLDADQRSVGFLFHSDVSDRDSFAFTTDGGSQSDSRIIQVQSIMAKNRWLRAAAEIEDKRARQYVPNKSPDGKWMISIRPSFEVRAARGAEVPTDISGIYRYLDHDEVVYIGRGRIRARLASPERDSWTFDSIEYSPIEEDDDQERWEADWLEEFRDASGFLPRYNRVGGARRE